MEEVELKQRQAEDLAMRACLGAGANPASARSLVDATVSAARFGPSAVGFPHPSDAFAASSGIEAACEAS